MPARHQREANVSPLYATLGPMSSALARHTKGDAHHAYILRADWQEWRDDYGEAWEMGLPVPDPPHPELDTYAKLG